MQKSFKIPAVATIVIMVLFVAQSFIILNLSQKEEASKNLFGIIKYENHLKSLFISGERLPDSLIYKYAILGADLVPVRATMTTMPSDFKFVVREQEGILYYKSFFFKDAKPYYIVIAQELNHARAAFYTALTLTLVLAVVFIVLYLFYASSVRPYQQLQRYMNNFFNDAMHELKTPLGVAGINLEMLGLDNKYTQRIKNALKQMQITYEDVEYYIKKGYIKFPKERLRLGLYLLERVQFLHSVAQAKHIELVPSADTDCEVLISKLAAQRIIDNTITNAIKYSPQGTQIFINFTREGESATLSVQDFGAGIKDTQRVWQRYVREDEVQGGFGLGLNIVAQICHRDEIEYDVKSELGKGSTFFYKFKVLK